MADTYQLQEKLSKFNREQLFLLMLNVTRIQLNTNCSIGCPDCGLGATPMNGNGLPREGYAMPFDYFTKLVDEQKDFWHGQLVNLYWRSEPFDYSSQGKGFLDAYEYFNQNVHLAAPLYIQTAVPSGTEEQVLRSLDIIGEIDVTHHRRRLSTLIDTIARDHPDYLRIFKEGNRAKLGPKNIGNLSPDPINCDNGVLLTPDGVYSFYTMKPNKEFPYGYKLWEVTPENFKIAASSWSPTPIHDNSPQELIMELHERWLSKGFHEINSPDNALFGGFQRYFSLRFSLIAAMKTNPVEFKPAIDHMLTNSEGLESELGRPFHSLEQELLCEMKDLVR